jgi:DNA-binding XRE family transcriptional regulator
VTAKRRALAERRQVVGHSQETLARLVGVEPTTVGRWERGETSPQPWCPPKLADGEQQMVRRRQARRVPSEFVLGVITDTVLDLRTEEGPVTTVAELDRHLDRITGDIADYRVRPVEVGLYDNTDQRPRPVHRRRRRCQLRRLPQPGQQPVHQRRPHRN